MPFRSVGSACDRVEPPRASVRARSVAIVCVLPPVASEPTQEVATHSSAWVRRRTCPRRSPGEFVRTTEISRVYYEILNESTWHVTRIVAAAPRLLVIVIGRRRSATPHEVFQIGGYLFTVPRGVSVTRVARPTARERARENSTEKPHSHTGAI